MNLKQSETKLNLMCAFAGESQARNRYNMASSVAKKEGHYLISKIFDITASQEQAHATAFYNFLKEENDTNFDICASYPVNCYDTTQKHIESAIANEYEEYSSAYKTFSEIAKKEGFNEISNTFAMIAEIEKTHAERFEAMATLLREGSINKGENDSIWVCTNCGHIHTGPAAPMLCPVCSHPQGYFVSDSFKNKIVFTI